jgi:hypothetical protein
MKFKLSIMLVVALIFVGCNKKDFFSNDEMTLKTIPILLPPPVSKPPRAGLYVNQFDTMIGDTSKENTLLRWAKKEGFNCLYLYGVSGIISNSATWPLLNSFIGRAKASPFYFSISFVAASSGTANNYYNLYYTNTSYPNKFDAINSEFEFWHCSGATSSPTNFTMFLPLLNAMNTINTNTFTPKVTRNIYVGEFVDSSPCKNESGPFTPYTSTAILTEIINKHDKILIANYHTNAGTAISPLLVAKLNALSAQAFAMGKIANVEILYNVNTTSASPNIYAYCVANPFITAYNNFITNYNASVSITNKASLRIVGYSYYRYTNAKLARP